MDSFNSVKFEKNIWLPVIYWFENIDRKWPQKILSVNNGLALWAERKPSVILQILSIYKALLDRLPVFYQHMIVWIGWVPSIP